MQDSQNTFKKTMKDLEQEERTNEVDFFQNTENTEKSNYLKQEKSNDIHENIKVEDSDEYDENNMNEEENNDDKWLNQTYDGKLSVDVYQTVEKIIIKAMVAGCTSDDIDISINNEVITIKGIRSQEDNVSPDNYFYQECYWGGFSRSIILPTEINPTQTEANIEDGVLTITLPKVEPKSINIKIQNS